MASRNRTLLVACPRPDAVGVWHGRSLDISAFVVLIAVADPRRHGAPEAPAPRPSPTAVPAPTYPANVMDVPRLLAARGRDLLRRTGCDGHPGLLHDPRGRLDQLVRSVQAGAGHGPAQFGRRHQHHERDQRGPRWLHRSRAADPPVGPTVDDMATALAALSPFVLTKPPSDVTVDGFSGKHLELTVPDIAVQVFGDDTSSPTARTASCGAGSGSRCRSPTTPTAIPARSRRSGCWTSMARA